MEPFTFLLCFWRAYLQSQWLVSSHTARFAGIIGTFPDHLAILKIVWCISCATGLFEAQLNVLYILNWHMDNYLSHFPPCLTHYWLVSQPDWVPCVHWVPCVQQQVIFVLISECLVSFLYANIALLWSGCTPPKNCSCLKNHFSAPNHYTDMKFFVYDPNTSKNNWGIFQVFSLLKIGRKSIKT